MTRSRGAVAQARRRISAAVVGALLALLVVPACTSTNNGRVDVSLTWSSSAGARAYGRDECARRPDAQIVRVHYYDASVGDADDFQQIDVHCPASGGADP